MKSNEELQKDVHDAIKWEPLLDAAQIGVIAQDGIITLTGMVDSYATKRGVEDAVKNVAGVKAVAEAIQINYPGTSQITDTMIANNVVNALKLKWIPDDKVKVRVEDGWIKLEGNLQWNFQKEAAQNCIIHLMGVMGVTNNIEIKPQSLEEVERKDVRQALARNWAIDDQNIDVKVLGNRVTLTGTVNSFYQKDEAGRIAWSAPGVLTVANELAIEY